MLRCMCRRRELAARALEWRLCVCRVRAATTGGRGRLLPAARVRALLAAARRCWGSLRTALLLLRQLLLRRRRRDARLAVTAALERGHAGVAGVRLNCSERIVAAAAAATR